MSNVSALRTLERCIHTKLAPCTVLYPRAVEWFELATRNPRVANRARAVLLLGLAKLYALDKRLDEAVATAEAAAATDPGQIHYLFELTALYLALGRLDAAERIIATAEHALGYSGFRHGVLRDLKRELEKARLGAKPAVADRLDLLHTHLVGQSVEAGEKTVQHLHDLAGMT